MKYSNIHTLGIDIGSTTVKIAILDSQNQLLFSDYERHYANIQETLAELLKKAKEKLGELQVCPLFHAQPTKVKAFISGM